MNEELTNQKAAIQDLRIVRRIVQDWVNGTEAGQVFMGLREQWHEQLLSHCPNYDEEDLRLLECDLALRAMESVFSWDHEDYCNALVEAMTELSDPKRMPERQARLSRVRRRFHSGSVN